MKGARQRCTPGEGGARGRRRQAKGVSTESPCMIVAVPARNLCRPHRPSPLAANARHAAAIGRTPSLSQGRHPTGAASSDLPWPPCGSLISAAGCRSFLDQ